MTNTFLWRGHRLAYEVYGDDGPTLVYVHGLLFDAMLNRGVARRLASQGSRVVLLDLLGHGASDKPAHASEHRMDVYADQVVALLDHLSQDRAVIGGISLGANVSLFVATRHPQRVSGLVVEAPVLERGVPAIVLQLAPQLLQTSYLPWLSKSIAGLGQRLPRTGVELVDSVVNMLSLPPKSAAAVLHGLLIGPLAPTVEERRDITVPTLVIGHDRDIGHPFADAVNLVGQLPNARIEKARFLGEMRVFPDRLIGAITAILVEAEQVGPR